MIVGVTAFVTVVSLIQGFNVYIDEKIAKIGAKSFSIQFQSFRRFQRHRHAAAQRRTKELTMDDYDFIKQRSVLIAKIGAKARSTPALINVAIRL
jgi:ABC-type lipoprotein release transport system permease subunit